MVKNTATQTALKKAISGEFNAIRKYKKFQKIAEEENIPNVARLFKALIVGETVHLHNHKRALGQEYNPDEIEFSAGTTLENLQDAMDGENWEYHEMYPELLKQMKKERKTEYAQVASLSFQWAREVELDHARILAFAFEDVKNNRDFEYSRFWVCKICGNLRIDENNREICPICKHDYKFYEEIK